MLNPLSREMRSRKILVTPTLRKHVKIIFAGVVGPTKSVTLAKLNNIQIYPDI